MVVRAVPVLLLAVLGVPGTWSLAWPTLAPPLTMLVNGEMRTLAVCIVDELVPDSVDSIWFSDGNGSVLDSFSYSTFSRGGGEGAAMAVSHLNIPAAHLATWESLSCHVAQKDATVVQRSHALHGTGEDCASAGTDTYSYPDRALVQLSVTDGDGTAAPVCHCDGQGTAALSVTDGDGTAAPVFHCDGLGMEAPCLSL
ncbi:pre T-cell antigen receptor alpha [Lissotriton helveticus]